MPKNAQNLYLGFGGAPPITFEKALSLILAGATDVTPTVVALGVFPPNGVLTAPSGAATITRGQPFTFAWTPLSQTGVRIGVELRIEGSTPGTTQRKICTADASAGTLTLPGTFTSTLLVGVGGYAVRTSTRAKTQITVGGMPCALRAVNYVENGDQLIVQ